MDAAIVEAERIAPRPVRHRSAPPIVVVPPTTPRGTLPPPAPPPFAGLPGPTSCPLPALGWQARRARPRRATCDAPRATAEIEVVVVPAPAVPAPAVLVPPVLVPPVPEIEHWHVVDDDLDEAVELVDDATGAPADRPERELVGVARAVGRGVAYAVVGAAGWVLLLTTVPRLAGWQPTVITGRSMEPAILRGDIVIVRPAPVAAYVPGAVVTFADINHPDRLVTHRVVGVRSDGALVTKGDNNRDDDPQPVEVTRVRGRAVLRVPLAGRPVVWFLDHRWLPLALTIGVLAAAVRTTMRPRRRAARPELMAR